MGTCYYCSETVTGSYAYANVGGERRGIAHVGCCNRRVYSLSRTRSRDLLLRLVCLILILMAADARALPLMALLLLCLIVLDRRDGLRKL